MLKEHNSSDEQSELFWMVVYRLGMNFDLNTQNDTGVHSLAKQITHILPGGEDRLCENESQKHACFGCVVVCFICHSHVHNYTQLPF